MALFFRNGQTGKEKEKEKVQIDVGDINEMIEDMKAAVIDDITDLDAETLQTETLENAVVKNKHTLIYFLKST